jgi:uncharacterized protein (TIGR01777 family)
MKLWNARDLGAWATELEGADVVINLAGRNVNCRYGAENRRAILDSRVHSTRVVGRAIAECKRPPALWLQASTATIYAHRYDAPNDEVEGWLGGQEPDVPAQWHFSIKVAQAWERAMDEVSVPFTRKVKLRSAMTMAPDRGGIFDSLLRLVRCGLGGPAASGRQYVSWIHFEDYLRAISWLIRSEDMQGAINIASPNPLPQAEFVSELRQAWGAPWGLPATRWMLEIGASLIGTETELLLKSRRVVPRRLLEAGFTFHYPDWPEAARDLCARWRETNEPARAWA